MSQGSTPLLQRFNRRPGLGMRFHGHPESQTAVDCPLTACRLAARKPIPTGVGRCDVEQPPRSPTDAVSHDSFHNAQILPKCNNFLTLQCNPCYTNESDPPSWGADPLAGAPGLVYASSTKDEAGSSAGRPRPTALRSARESGRRSPSRCACSFSTSLLFPSCTIYV